MIRGSLNLPRLPSVKKRKRSRFAKLSGMAILLFRLRHVPEDEAEEVRQLLTDEGIAFYETLAGNWRISMPAIWLSDDSQLDQARELLDRYQEARLAKARMEYEARIRDGSHETLWKKFLREPVKVSFYLGAALLVLYLSVQVFLSLGSS